MIHLGVLPRPVRRQPAVLRSPSPSTAVPIPPRLVDPIHQLGRHPRVGQREAPSPEANGRLQEAREDVDGVRCHPEEERRSAT